MKLPRRPRSTITPVGQLYSATLDRVLDPTVDPVERAAANRFMRALGDEMRTEPRTELGGRKGFHDCSPDLRALVCEAIDQRTFGRT